MSDSPVDLSQLAVDRSKTSSNNAHPNRLRFVIRYLIPAGIVLGFLGLLYAAAGTSLFPRQSVEVIPVVVKRAELQAGGTPLFQAAGWIEPRPTSIGVPALAPGVIEELLVVEGQQVVKGEAIAKLISIDAELDVQQAEAALAIREGELHRAEAELRAARIRLEKPVHLKVQLADANSLLAKTQTERFKLPFLIEAAEAELEYARSSLEGKKSAGAAVPGLVVQQAVSQQAVASAKLRELRQREPNLQREIDSLQNKVDALREQLDLLVEETRQVQEAEAKVQSSTALRNESNVRVKQANLTLDRNVIRAPINGRILKLIAFPGTRVMGQDNSSGQNSNTVVEMYDPARLQVRADVRLEDVPLVQPRQPVEIETASSKKVIRGLVLQTTSTANIQKNTLEVKVELIEPPSTVSPEMLVKTTFLSMETALNDGAIPKSSERIFVPERLIQSMESQSSVWIVDANNCAQQRTIVVGQARDGEMIEVESGLVLTDKLISSSTAGLSPGKQVKVTAEDLSSSK